MIFQPVGVRSRFSFRSVASFARSRVAHERFLLNRFQSFVVPMPNGLCACKKCRLF
jgi:hypothetical protein